MTIRAGGMCFEAAPAHTVSPSAAALGLRHIGHATTIDDIGH